MNESSQYGKIVNHLNELLKEKNISKTKLSYMAEMSRTQINAFCNNQITRYDAYTISRLMKALDLVNINDLISYIPPEKASDLNSLPNSTSEKGK